MNFALKKTRLCSPASNRSPILLSLFLARTSTFMHDWSRHSILSQSRVPLYEKYITVIHALGSTQSWWVRCMNQLLLQRRIVPADPAEFKVVCCTKPDLPYQTDSNAALQPYLTHQLGSAHEWSGVWNANTWITVMYLQRDSWLAQNRVA